MNEKFKTSESREKIKKRSLLGVFCAAFLTTTTAEALELKDGSWEEGLRQLEGAVYDSKKEWAALYVDGGDGLGGWVNPLEGHEDSVGRHSDDIFDIEAEAYVSNSTHVTVCSAHTHPAELGEAYIAGVSIGDINEQIQFKEAVADDEDIVEGNITTTVTGMVFDLYGVWYYETEDGMKELTEAEEGAAQDILNKMEKFTDTLKDDEVTAEETITALERLEDTYYKYGVNVRFVGYDHLLDEPPCAGPDYVAPE